MSTKDADETNARLWELHARIAGETRRRATPLKLIGGMAIELRARNELPELRRSFGDLDYVAGRGQRREVASLFEAAGFVRDPGSAHAAHRRQVWWPPEQDTHIDVFLGRFEMCHTLDFEERLGVSHPALGAADLLLTKLQIVELNDKDIVDVVRLLGTHQVGPTNDDGVVEIPYLTRLLARDWGLFTTVSDNLRTVAGHPLAAETPEGRRAGACAVALLELIEAAPKSSSFRMRARVGRRKRWYRLPEEVDLDMAGDAGGSA